MINKVKQFIVTHDLIRPETRHLFAAVSGGIDSCVLLYILNQLKEEYSYTLHVLHFNHKTRGKNSDADQQFVEDLAAAYQLDIRIGTLSAQIRRKSETVLREERYKFFQKILSRFKNAVLATGHNRDDNIETFLMRLGKGSGLKGLLAIRPKRNNYIRPLLELSRKEIKAFCTAHDLTYRQDSSNEDLLIVRNKIRHKILPFLQEELDPAFDKNLEKAMLNLSYYYGIYQEKLKEAVAASTKNRKKGISLNRKRYSYFNPVIKRGLIEYCISKIYQLNYKVTDRNFLIWDRFITEAQTGKKHSFLDNGIAVAERHQIIFGDVPENRDERYPLKLGQPLKIKGKFTISLNKIEANHVQYTSNRDVEYIDGTKSGNQLIVRYWQQGDYFKPLGMDHRRKLSDFFIDLKLSAFLKKEIPLVCKKDQIVWIAGYRLDDTFKVTDKTKLFYRLEIDKKS
jgi:tRNA(Ile)-lysidine synthase